MTDAAVVGLLFTGYSQSATLTNEPGGTIELRADSRIRQVNSGGWPPAELVFVNQGQIVSSTAGTNWIESSTNLVHWRLDFTTNAPADTLTFVDPRTPLDPVRFYRVGVLP